MATGPTVESLDSILRELFPLVLARLIRRTNDFDRSEDAVSEAMLAAAQQWPTEGIPDDPRAWLTTVAARRLTDIWRSESARRRREAESTDQTQRLTAVDDPSAVGDGRPAIDDSTELILLCCHPELSPSSQVALTLRAVGGLTTAEIAAAFLVPEATMTRRITRAKQTINAVGGRFGEFDPTMFTERLPSVLRVLYLIFNEGYLATSGDRLARVDLSSEAIRLARRLHKDLPDEAELTGLLALMLLTDARRPARVDDHGRLIPLTEQDRTVWLRDLIDEGTALLTDVLPRSEVGSYQVQAAIAAVHDEAIGDEEPDWVQILELYRLLETIDPSPMASLGRVVAVAMVHGPQAGLEACEELDDRLGDHYRLHGVRGHLLELAGRTDAAARAYRNAAERTASRPEREYLTRRADRLNRRVRSAGPAQR